MLNKGQVDVTSGSLVSMCRRIVQEEGVWSLWKGNLTSVIHRFPYSALNFAAYDAVTKLVRGQGFSESPATRFVCGASAGGIACIACYPLDLVRTRLMASRVQAPPLVSSPVPSSSSGTAWGIGTTSSVSSGTSSSSSSGRGSARRSVMGSIASTVSNILREEGVGGLYRGLLISLWVTIPTFGISFCVYGTVKERILQFTPATPFPWSLLKDHTTGHLSPYGSMCSGALSGLTSSLLLFPADVVRRRMQVAGLLKAQVPDAPSSSSSSPSPSQINVNRLPGGRSGALAEMYSMARTEGVRGLYRGILPEILKITPMVSITFCVYEWVLDLIEPDEE